MGLIFTVPSFFSKKKIKNDAIFHVFHHFPGSVTDGIYVIFYFPHNPRKSIRGADEIK